VINVCTNSDFFIEDADYMRDELWEMIYERSDCLFNITTKRPERIFQCLPSNWLLGWDNVIISICVEDNLSALYRLPLLSRLQEIGIRHIGIALQPMLEDMDIISFIGSGYVDRVTVSGENYLGCMGLARILEMAWVYKIREQCNMFEVAFKFVSTGSRLRLLNGQVIDIKWHDQRGLAKFYKLSLFDDKDIVNIWKSNASEIEKRQNIEAAHKIYCIYEEYLRGKQCEKS
jgi:protein gp37